MAVIACTTILNATYNNTDANSYVTASQTPTANRLVLMIVQTRLASASLPPTSLTGNGITWVQIAVQGTGSHNISVWRGRHASPSAGAVTIDYNGVTQLGCGYVCVEFTNAKVSPNGEDSVVKIGGTNANANTITVDGDSSNTQNATLGVISIAVNEAITFGAGNLALQTNGSASGSAPATSFAIGFYNANANSQVWSWTTSSTPRAILLDIINTDASLGIL